MKQILQRLLASAALVVGLSFATGGVALAAPVDVLDTDACNGSNLCADTSGGIFGLIKTIINVMLMIAGIITVIVIIIGGISYTTSSGDQSKVTQAKNTILYAVIGLVVTILAYAIVNFVIGKI